jgi:hypothetical protein
MAAGRFGFEGLPGGGCKIVRRGCKGNPGVGGGGVITAQGNFHKKTQSLFSLRNNRGHILEEHLAVVAVVVFLAPTHFLVFLLSV